ncbi:MAG: GNAT family N-acetyltransferase [Candidatus Magasanikbacteria bacterium CG_4_10_14_0_2_um_filter_37_12]|uniref:GNAT family N-acetyltransferase n=1 Tax=Candidatus Magasanikbacteria bacterium CG_4_10_14_0_2_um_filter_37_12 TaxID=1974637 RepID=A0A2M7V8P9_9BACT|nr:MAG: GNAT family N-acetyltransferase [Candidatus Magasanikbacteria bacterium CG_4_10_14_0_2_um_filter_37_12]
MLKLVKPSYKYRHSFLEALDEYGSDHISGIFHIDLAYTNFKKYLSCVRNQERGIDLTRGIVPSSAFWLIDGDEFVGAVSFRHKLNKRLREYGGHIGYSIRPSKRKKRYGTMMLAMALTHVKKYGLKKIIIMCDYDNTASQKIIKANGGVLHDTIKTKSNSNKKLIMHWWIDLV